MCVHNDFSLSIKHIKVNQCCSVADIEETETPFENIYVPHQLSISIDKQFFFAINRFREGIQRVAEC